MTAAEVLPSVGKYIKHSFTKSYIGSTLHSLYVCGIGIYTASLPVLPLWLEELNGSFIIIIV